MHDTLGFWDGQRWTDQTQPTRVTAQTRRHRGRAIGIVIAAVVLGAFTWFVVTADDDLDCASERAEAAAEGLPRPDC